MMRKPDERFDGPFSPLLGNRTQRFHNPLSKFSFPSNRLTRVSNDREEKIHRGVVAEGAYSFDDRKNEFIGPESFFFPHLHENFFERLEELVPPDRAHGTGGKFALLDVLIGEEGKEAFVKPRVPQHPKPRNDLEQFFRVTGSQDSEALLNDFLGEADPFLPGRSLSFHTHFAGHGAFRCSSRRTSYDIPAFPQCKREFSIADFRSAILSLTQLITGGDDFSRAGVQPSS